MPDLRILGGAAKGRALLVPASARPTGARLRKSLFDLLAVRTQEGRFLDLYAGSGAVGLEAASRGYQVTLCEKNAGAVSALTRNARTLNLRPTVLRGDALRLLPSLGAFEIIFLDPPYAQDIPGAARAVLDSGAISEGGRLAVQHPVQLNLPEHAEYELERRVYGSNVLTLYTRLA